MKKVIVLTTSLLILYLTYRLIYDYRVIAISNDGDLKYKESIITYFPQPPLSIINPFKKAKLLGKIHDYCNSNEFEKYHSSNNYRGITHRDFFHYQRLAIENSLKVKAIKHENGLMLILVSHSTDNELELVFKLDIETDKIVGFY
jgi:hypothetical protein